VSTYIPLDLKDDNGRLFADRYVEAEWREMRRRAEGFSGKLARDW